MFWSWTLGGIVTCPSAIVARNIGNRFTIGTFDCTIGIFIISDFLAL